MAKLDHILFKINAYNGVFNNTETTLTDHHHCRFGKWIETEGRKLFSHTSEFASIEQPHAAVHNNAIAALECVRKGECLHNIDVVVNLFKQTEEASKQLFIVLDNMLAEAKTVKSDYTS
ncbi:CZB domain-containing protein [Hydrogenimonas urashimensis]|uniref:CZB domain-containing protein n=1 Tax=Hydrogenimonas urashimensis TaxID=2740515 RepID=UPI001F2C38B5